ncbi:gtp-binding protein ypt1 [Anaeramoeba ignava]|uniref:Gtp-binding protein ypt1 n=1 Tax=Anaeramoeba ignava TaxID=1746090 RepID=A0A9Q0LN07_ANAIG|nr:gtp-binding protein ypt1 [Anaeramoeba ignava]
MSFDFLCKTILVGASGVGKTSLIQRYIDDIFIPEKDSTIGIDYKTKDVEIEDSTFRLQIWDTAGQEKFHISLSSSIYKNTNVLIVVFDLTNKETVNSLEYYFTEIENNCRKNPLIVLVGNKCDLIENQIENVEEKVKQISNEKEFKLFKTSAKERTNVNELFYYIAKTIKENPKKYGVIKQNKLNKNENLKEENLKEVDLNNDDNNNFNNKKRNKCC